MKSFKEFNEAISAARLAQLAAKGKGGAAAAQMKADGTRPAQPVVKKPLPNPAAKKPMGSVKTVTPGTGVPSSMGGRSKPRTAPKATAPKMLPPTRPQAADKGGSIVRTKRGGTGKEAVGAPKMGNRTGSKTYAARPKPYSTDGAKPVNRKPIDKKSALVKPKPQKPDRFKKAKKAFGKILRDTANQGYKEPQENKGNLSGGRVTGEVR